MDPEVESEKSEEVTDQEVEESSSAEEEEEDNSKQFEIKDLEPKPYESKSIQETEDEVKSLTVPSTRPLLSLKIAKKRRYYGQIMTKFSTTESAQPLEIMHMRDPNFKKENYKLTLDIGLQAGCGIKLLPQPKGRGFQSNYFISSQKTSIYSKDDFYDEHMNLIDKIEDVTEAPKLEHFIRNVEVKIEEALQSNETIDVFHDEFEILGDKEGESGGSGGNLANLMTETRTFYNLDFTREKTITDIQWEPGKDNVIAACCVENFDFSERVEKSGSNIIGTVMIWSFAEFNSIIMILKAPLEITCFRFNPNKTNIIVAGTISGTVVMWDTKLVNDKSRRDMLPKQHEAPELNLLTSSGIFDSHKGPVRSLCWLPTQVKIERKNHFLLLPDPQDVTQIATLSEDGLILFWETNFPLDKNPIKNADYQWQPLLKVQLTRPDNRNDIGGSGIWISPGQKDTQFWATSDSGDLLRVDWLARAIDEGRPEYVKKIYFSDVSYRPALSLQVSPFFTDIVLTVHDFHFTIWKDSCDIPIFQSYYHATYLTCGAWSPMRPAMLFIGRADGRIDVWDFLDQSHKESLYHNISGQRISTMTFLNLKKTHNQILATGDIKGNVHIIEIHRHASKDVEREKKTIYEFWCKEEERVSYFAERFEVRSEEFRQQEILRRQQQHNQASSS